MPPLSNSILYCFVSHQSVLDKDITAISSMCEEINISDYLIVCGGSDSDILSNNILQLNCSDTYEGLPSKVYRMFSYVSTNLTNHSHYAKLDRTTQIKQPIPNSIIQNKDYCGLCVKVRDGMDGNRTWHKGKCSAGSEWNTKKYAGKFIPWCRGLGYIISSKAANVISCHPPKLDYHIYEDLYVSETLYDNSSIRPVPFPKITDYLIDRE